MARTCGEALMQLLEAYGVTTVFGIPGEHTLELYRGIGNAKLRAVTPRNEQGASLMADGYARVTGEPGVCTLITGPGVTNASTGIGQAYADSIPMLVISSANGTPARNHRPVRDHAADYRLQRNGARPGRTARADRAGLRHLSFTTAAPGAHRDSPRCSRNAGNRRLERAGDGQTALARAV
jgi:hypothetical protein